MWREQGSDKEKNRNVKGDVLRLLSLAWMLYAEAFPDGRNYDRFLAAIQEVQLAVFEEEETGA